MKATFLLFGLVCSAVMCFGIVSRADHKKEAPPRYEVVEHDQGSDGAGLFLTDRKTSEMISIYNGKRGAVVAFYGKEKRRDSMPKLAFSADGIQIVASDGKVRHLDLEELATLDKK